MAAITVRRQSKEDVGYRDSITREPIPGAHRLQAHNTLFWKTSEFTLAIDEHASFGAGPFHLTFERENIGAHGS